MSTGLNIAFFGSSLASAQGNGAAAYFRGLIHALYDRGHSITFYEPDAFQRQQHRDLSDPDWARVVVYGPNEQDALKVVEEARHADLVIKASGIGVHDELLEREVLNMRRPGTLVAFLDMDAPDTLERIHVNPADAFRTLIPGYNLVLTCGGGKQVINAYLAAGARQCVPIYNALDPRTHHPVPRETRFSADLAFLGNRLPDREIRVEKFFLRVADALPEKNFLLGGSGWTDKPHALNIHYAGHVHTRDHNAFNCTPNAILNVTRESKAHYGFSPSPRVFEAAGAGACLITDAWEGVELFLEPGREVLVARDGREVVKYLCELTEERSRSIGQAAMKRLLAEHTYAHRAIQLEEAISGSRRNVVA